MTARVESPYRRSRQDQSCRARSAQRTAPELAKQGGLALHHRQRRRRADIAQTEHRSPVADNRDQSRPPGIAISKRDCRPLSPGRPRRRRGVGERERLTIDERDACCDTVSLPPSCARNTGTGGIERHGACPILGDRERTVRWRPRAGSRRRQVLRGSPDQTSVARALGRIGDRTFAMIRLGGSHAGPSCRPPIRRQLGWAVRPVAAGEGSLSETSHHPPSRPRPRA